MWLNTFTVWGHIGFFLRRLALERVHSIGNGRGTNMANLSVPNPHLLAYVADLELEVDRLRKHSGFVQQKTLQFLKKIQMLCSDQNSAEDGPHMHAEISGITDTLASTIRDLKDPPGFHPAHDQVIPIAVRPLLTQVFRSQQHLENAPQASFRLELESEYVEWFPARLRHVLDNLISNALKFRDAQKQDCWVSLRLRVSANGYEFTVCDNGVGMSRDECVEIFALLHRAAPGRNAGLGVGLAVVKLLIEQSGGSLIATSGAGQGTTMVVFLPRYEVDDFLT
jgi:signal transduction histidine kinase